MINGNIWKTKENSFTIEVKYTNDKEREYAESNLSDWKQIGEGTSKNGEVVLFSKTFPNEETSDVWLKSFRSFNLQILDKDGRVKKKIKSKVIEIEKPKQNRVCSICHKNGHNSATCHKQNKL